MTNSDPLDHEGGQILKPMGVATMGVPHFSPHRRHQRVRAAAFPHHPPQESALPHLGEVLLVGHHLDSSHPPDDQFTSDYANTTTTTAGAMTDRPYAIVRDRSSSIGRHVTGSVTERPYHIDEDPYCPLVQSEHVWTSLPSRVTPTTTTTTTAFGTRSSVAINSNSRSPSQTHSASSHRHSPVADLSLVPRAPSPRAPSPRNHHVVDPKTTPHGHGRSSTSRPHPPYSDPHSAGSNSSATSTSGALSSRIEKLSEAVLVPRTSYAHSGLAVIPHSVVAREVAKHLQKQ